MTKVIGLTGGIGSGKSTVSRFLAELGAVIIDADKVGHEAFRPNTDTWHKVVAAFGQQILDTDGTIDREKLGRIVFSDAEARARLNQMMHPVIYRMVKAQIDQYRRQGVSVVVLEAPLLLEAGWISLVDEVWVTTAPETTILKRLKARTGLSVAEALARIRTQLPTEERIKHADLVIDTGGSLEELKIKIKKLWQELKT